MLTHLCSLSDTLPETVSDGLYLSLKQSLAHHTWRSPVFSDRNELTMSPRDKQIWWTLLVQMGKLWQSCALSIFHTFRHVLHLCQAWFYTCATMSGSQAAPEMDRICPGTWKESVSELGRSPDSWELMLHLRYRCILLSTEEMYLWGYSLGGERKRWNWPGDAAGGLEVKWTISTSSGSSFSILESPLGLGLGKISLWVSTAGTLLGEGVMDYDTRKGL